MRQGAPAVAPANGKPAILVLMGGYWPGHDATGPNQSLRHLVERLSSEFAFRIIARDRAPGASQPAAPSGRWIDDGQAAIRYCRIGPFGAKEVAALLRASPYDALVMNGFFDREFTIPALILRRLGLIPRRPAILSPRGELGAGALSLKPRRKRAWLELCRHSGLLSDVWLHATGMLEAADIKTRFPWSKGILIAGNVRELPPTASRPKDVHKSPGRLRLVFVGRVARVKNVGFAVEVLRQVAALVDFEIYGPVAEPGYWGEVTRLIQSLPPHVRVTYRGEVPHAGVARIMASADLLFLPSLGENFGHAIFEALSCGVPVLISDRTPWQDLQNQRAGWSLPLDQPEAFVLAIDSFARMPLDRRAELREGARRVAERFVAQSDAVAANRRMLLKLIAENGAALPVSAPVPRQQDARR